MVTSEIAMQPPRTMAEIYQCLPEGTPVQLIENRLIVSPSATTNHQVIAARLFTALNAYIERKSLGKVLFAPYDVYFDTGNIFQPDIIFIANDNLKNIRENGFHGAPDLVIEILSPSTARYDLKDKKKVHERNGVKEYWIADPAKNMAVGFSLTKGKFQEFFKGKNELKSELLGIKVEF